ncbi:hypothetical protein FISHEDRAFT_78027 [Fistulina hepatica ATCC 64428]|nr:hypothetical protein FISHEDRAFT_78027 [Fistulina hepatica ATCC 64428]
MSATPEANLHDDPEKASLHAREHADNALHLTNTGHTMHLTDEQYDRLFQHMTAAGHTARPPHKFGDPTAMGLMCFLLVLTPTSTYLMGWGGSSSAAFAAIVGPYYMFGGAGLIIAGIMEWIINNAFACAVFITFGSFWAGLGCLEDPMHDAAAAFATGTKSVDYNTGLMLYFAFWALACIVFLIASFRTNLMFVIIFMALIPTFALLSAAYGVIARNGDAVKILQASGAFGWICCCAGWYLTLSLVCMTTDMPFTLPIGDLSGFLVKKTRTS